MESPSYIGGAPEDGGGQDVLGSKPVLEAWFLDVGQGDCILLVSPNEKTMLVDAGPAGSYDVIHALTQKLGIQRLDVVVATHNHADHIGGMIRVVENYEIGSFYYADYPVDNGYCSELADVLRQRRVHTEIAQASMTSLIGWDRDVQLRIVSPLDVDYEDANEASIAMVVAYGSTGIFLAGDTGALAERVMLKALPNDFFKAAVLKLGHHGSYSSTTEKFLNAVGPLLAIACCGRNNDYGHPDKEIVALLESRGIPLLSTAQNGTIHISLDGITVRVIE